jgi:hypothetical protein
VSRTLLILGGVSVALCVLVAGVFLVLSLREERVIRAVAWAAIDVERYQAVNRLAGSTPADACNFLRTTYQGMDPNPAPVSEVCGTPTPSTKAADTAKLFRTVPRLQTLCSYQVTVGRRRDRRS